MGSYILHTERLGLRLWIDSDIKPFAEIVFSAGMLFIRLTKLLQTYAGAFEKIWQEIYFLNFWE
jgi:hypothetical protein